MEGNWRYIFDEKGGSEHCCGGYCCTTKAWTIPFFRFRIIVSFAEVHFLSWMEAAWGLLVHFSHGIDSQSSDRASERATESGWA